MFAVRKLVSATIRMDGQAASAAHSSLFFQVGGGPSWWSSAASGLPLRPRQASRPPATTKQTKSPDHRYDCQRVGKNGSTASG